MHQCVTWLTCWPPLRPATALEKAPQKKAWLKWDELGWDSQLGSDLAFSPLLLSNLQGGEPDGVQVFLHPHHLVQRAPQVAQAVIQILNRGI